MRQRLGLKTVVKHQSYNGNKGIGKLSSRMFPDSNVAPKPFPCGGDETAYVTKFDLAEHLKKGRVNQVYDAPSV